MLRSVLRLVAFFRPFVELNVHVALKWTLRRGCAGKELAGVSDSVISDVKPRWRAGWASRSMW
jgi:hypothetical protein